MKIEFKKSLLKSIRDNSQRTAFVIDGKEFSYEHLHERICAIQFALKMSVPAPSCVGIAISNTLDVYASILASWLLGITTVPINVTFPRERILDALEQSKVELILSAQRFEVPTELPSISLCELVDCEAECDDVDCGPDEVLYILFTSGSTGRPKGVPITTGNFEAFLRAYFYHGLGMTPEDRALQMFDLTFDVSIAAFVVPLLSGASIYTVSDEGLKNQNIAKLLLNAKLTFTTLVPSVLNTLKPYFAEIELPEMRMCILTAEASHCDVVESWRKCVPNSRIINLYGPTEATIWCAIYDATSGRCKGYNNMLAIGNAFHGTTLKIVKEDFADTNVYEKGELLISSLQLTADYVLKQPKNPFLELQQNRFYRTGDLCYFDEEGDIHYCGRIDHQVQIQGYRVELSEVEVAFEKAFGEKGVAISYPSGKDRKLAIGIFSKNSQLRTEVVRDALRSYLPSYMIPSVYISIEEFPLTASNKVDRVALIQRCCTQSGLAE